MYFFNETESLKNNANVSVVYICSGNDYFPKKSNFLIASLQRKLHSCHNEKNYSNLIRTWISLLTALPGNFSILNIYKQDVPSLLRAFCKRTPVEITQIISLFLFEIYYSWLPITQTLVNSDLALTGTKVDFQPRPQDAFPWLQIQGKALWGRACVCRVTSFH